jgi:hypothetical protein
MAIPYRVRLTLCPIDVISHIMSRGLLTLVIGLATFFKMPPCVHSLIDFKNPDTPFRSPTQTKSWFRPKGWFTEREEVIAVSRILRDDPTKVTYVRL